MAVLMVEGIDGSGKTTTIYAIKEAVKDLFEEIEIYSPNYTEMKKGISESDFREKCFHIYKDKFEMYQDEQDKLLIMDRAFLTNIAYSYEYDWREDVVFLVRNQEKYIILLLDIPKHVFIERNKNHEHPIHYNPELRRTMLDFGSIFSGIICDSSKLSPQEIVNLTVDKLKSKFLEKGEKN